MRSLQVSSAKMIDTTAVQTSPRHSLVFAKFIVYMMTNLFTRTRPRFVFPDTRGMCAIDNKYEKQWTSVGGASTQQIPAALRPSLCVCRMPACVDWVGWVSAWARCVRARAGCVHGRTLIHTHTRRGFVANAEPAQSKGNQSKLNPQKKVGITAPLAYEVRGPPPAYVDEMDSKVGKFRLIYLIY